MKYNYYLIEINEPTSSAEFPSVRVMMEKGYSVRFRGDKAELVLDVLKGNGLMMTDEQILATLREKDEKIKVMQEQIEGYYKNKQDFIKETERLERQHTNQKQTIIDQNNAIDALKKRNAELIKENQQLKDMYDGRSEFITEQGVEKRKLMEENQKLRKKNGDLAERNFDLAEVLEKKNAEINRLYGAGYGDKRVYDLVHEIKKLGMKNKELEGMYNTQCEVVKDQQKQLEGGHEYMYKLEKRIEEQKTTIGLLEKSYAEAMGEKDKEIAILTEENQNLRKALYVDDADLPVLKKLSLTAEKVRLESKNKKLEAQNARFRDACINAGLRLKELHTYLTSLDEE